MGLLVEASRIYAGIAAVDPASSRMVTSQVLGAPLKGLPEGMLGHDQGDAREDKCEDADADD